MTRSALLTGAGALALGLLFLSQLSASSGALPVQRETILVDLDPVAPDIWVGVTGNWTRRGFDDSGWGPAQGGGSSGFGQWIWVEGSYRRVLFRTTFQAHAGDQADFRITADEARFYLNGALVSNIHGGLVGDASAFIVEGGNIVALDVTDYANAADNQSQVAFRLEGPFGRLDSSPHWKTFIPEEAPEALGSGWIAVDAPSITRRSNPTVTVSRISEAASDSLPGLEGSRPLNGFLPVRAQPGRLLIQVVDDLREAQRPLIEAGRYRVVVDTVD
jgi:hypothetical protein